MAESRKCVHCGAVFEPRREHARFCSARCRVAWNQEQTNGHWAHDSALGWAMIAMHDPTWRLRRIGPADQSQAFALIGEAVWRVTIVDATLVRYHPGDYDSTLAGLMPGEGHVVEGIFGGLRFIRNQMGCHADHADFIRPCPAADSLPAAPVAGWTWKPVPEPAPGLRAPRGQAWEMTRHRAYQAHLAGRAIGETFQRAEAFLRAAAAAAGAALDPGRPAR